MTASLAIPACFDAVAIEDLRAILSEDEIQTLLATFTTGLDATPQLIATLVERGDAAGARAEAHRFKGGAMYFGHLPIVDMVERIETGPESELPAVASRVVVMARALADEIRGYAPA